MVRAKRGIEPMERVKNQILNSECFSQLVLKFESRKAFIEFAQSKIVPVQGDLLQEGLAMSEEDKALVTDNCNVIINSAASVSFDDPLQDALAINYFGSFRMLQLAKQCKKIDVFTQVSTAYVNCNRQGFIEEKIYDENLDFEPIVSKIMGMSLQQVTEQEKKLIGKFPNTYTFTKNLAKKNLMKNRGDVKVVIHRPAIIACSNK